MSQLFFYPVLKALSDGWVIRRTVATALQVIAILSLLGGAYLLIEMLKAVFQLPTDGTVGGLLFAVIFLASILSVAQVFWFRAGAIRELGDSPFTVIPIVSVLLRTAGEVYATLGVAVGVGGCLFIWFAKFNPLGLLGGLGGMLPSSSTEGTFLGGLSFLASMGVASFLVLILFYFLAESVVVLVDVALHVRLLVRQSGPAPAAAQPMSHCPACGGELEPGARFCPACGAVLTAPYGR
jgi:hypothetical protein